MRRFSRHIIEATITLPLCLLVILGPEVVARVFAAFLVMLLGLLVNTWISQARKWADEREDWREACEGQTRTIERLRGRLRASGEEAD